MCRFVSVPRCFHNGARAAYGVRMYLKQSSVLKALEQPQRAANTYLTTWPLNMPLSVLRWPAAGPYGVTLAWPPSWPM